MAESLSNQIRTLIKGNRLEQAGELLLDSAFSDEAISLLSRFRELKQQQSMVSSEELQLRTNRIRKEILDLANALERKEVKRKPIWMKRWALIGGFALGLFGVIGIWQIMESRQGNESQEKLDCGDLKQAYTILVADFTENQPHNVSRQLSDQLFMSFNAEADRVRVVRPKQTLEREQLMRSDSLQKILNSDCLEKGIILYGNLNEFNEEKFLNCYIHLVNLDYPEFLKEESSDGPLIMSNNDLKVPKDIKFNIPLQIDRVSEFTTALLKYYLGDTTSILGFISTQDELGTAENTLLDVANFYLGNAYLLADKPEQALESFLKIENNESLQGLAQWNKSLAHVKLENYEEAASGFSEYAETKNLSDRDSSLILQFVERVKIILPKQKASEILSTMKGFSLLDSARGLTHEDYRGFTASNIFFFSNGVDKPIDIIKLKDRKTVGIHFTLEGYKMPNGQKDIYLVLENVYNQEIFQSKHNQSASFKLNRKKTPYTALIKADYQGNEMELSSLIKEDVSEFKEAIYYAFIYHENHLLGKRRFVIQKEESSENEFFLIQGKYVLGGRINSSPEFERSPGFVAKDIVFWQNGVNKAVKVIKIKGLKEINVNFMLEGYQVPHGEKTIFLVVKNALTNKTFQSKNNKSGTFDYRGSAIPYTTYIKANYQGSALNISRPLIQDKSSRFEQGIYDVFIYHDGRLMGKGRIGIQK